MDQNDTKNSLVTSTDSTKLKKNEYWRKSGVQDYQMNSDPCGYIYNSTSPYDLTDDNFWPVVGQPNQSKQEAILAKKYPTIYGDIALAQNSDND